MRRRMGNSVEFLFPSNAREERPSRASRTPNGKGGILRKMRREATLQAYLGILTTGAIIFRPRGSILRNERALYR